MCDKDIEQEMEMVSEELDKCEKRRLAYIENKFWKMVTYVVIGLIGVVGGTILSTSRFLL